MKNSQAPATRADLRQALLGTSATFRTIIVEDAAGNKYELRQPSIEGRAQIRKAATTVHEDGTTEFDPLNFMLRAALHMTYVPGTDEKVFDPEDFDAFFAMPAGGFIDELSQKASELLNIDGAKVKKGSGATTKGK